MIYLARDFCLKLSRTLTSGFVTNFFRRIFTSHILSDVSRNSHLFVTLLVQPEHFKLGKIDSCMNDPLALAIKDRLELSALKGDLVAVGEDEIFLIRDNKCYLSSFNPEKFYLPQPRSKPRVVSLKFFEV